VLPSKYSMQWRYYSVLPLKVLDKAEILFSVAHSDIEVLNVWSWFNVWIIFWQTLLEYWDVLVTHVSHSILGHSYRHYRVHTHDKCITGALLSFIQYSFNTESRDRQGRPSAPLHVAFMARLKCSYLVSFHVHVPVLFLSQCSYDEGFTVSLSVCSTRNV